MGPGPHGRGAAEGSDELHMNVRGAAGELTRPLGLGVIFEHSEGLGIRTDQEA